MTQDQLGELFKMVNNYHLLYIAKNIGPEQLTFEEKKILEGLGVELNMIRDHQVPLKKMFRLGILSSKLGHDNLKKLTSPNFERFLEENQRLPLSRLQRNVFDLIQRQATKDVRKQAERIKEGLENISLEESRIDRGELTTSIIEEMGEGVLKRDTASNIARKLQARTGDWSRDFLRISEYVNHSAFEEGKVAGLIEDEGPDVLVFKDVMPGGCHNCIRAYLTNGEGSAPRVFKLSELMANGTNIGLKQAEWKPVVGSMHPHCFVLDKTLFLTNNGWKSYDDVLDSDLLMSYSEGEFKMSKIVGRVDYLYEGEIHKWENYFVTPNHKMLARRRTSKLENGIKKRIELELNLEESKNLPQSVTMYRGGFEWEGEKGIETIDKFSYSFKIEDYVEFMAWYLSEGNINEHVEGKTWEIKISQSKEKYFDKVLDCAQRCFDGVWGTGKEAVYIYVNNEFGNWLNGFGKSFEKFIPEEIKVLEKRLLNIFLETYLLGDGTVRKSTSSFKGYSFKGEERSISTISERMMGDLSEIILKLGFIPSIQKENYWSNRRNYLQDKFTISILTQSNRMSPKKEILPFQRVRVGCFETEYGTLIVGNSQEKNMKPLVSGNCRCTLHKLPVGYVWDPKTRSFSKPDKEAIPKLKPEIAARLGDAKMKIRVGNQYFNI